MNTDLYRTNVPTSTKERLAGLGAFLVVWFLLAVLNGWQP